jgi:hypothetical protein
MRICLIDGHARGKIVITMNGPTGQLNVVRAAIFGLVAAATGVSLSCLGLPAGR